MRVCPGACKHHSCEQCEVNNRVLLRFLGKDAKEKCLCCRQRNAYYQWDSCSRVGWLLPTICHTKTTAKLAHVLMSSFWKINVNRKILRICRMTHCASLCITVHHCASLCITVHHCASLCITVHHCTSLCITVHHCTSLCIYVINAVVDVMHHCSMQNKSITDMWLCIWLYLTV